MNRIRVAPMNCIRVAISLLLVVGVTAVIVEGAVETGNAPRVPPESTTTTGPEPKLPEEFFACWEGLIAEFDTAESYTFVSDEALRAAAVNTAYEFCFSPRSDGTGRLVLKKIQAGGNELPILHFDNRMTAVDAVRHRGSMRSHIITESIVRLLWIIPLYLRQEIYAEEDLEMKSRDLIVVQGKQLVMFRGAVVAEMTFHTDFHRVSQ